MIQKITYLFLLTTLLLLGCGGQQSEPTNVESNIANQEIKAHDEAFDEFVQSAIERVEAAFANATTAGQNDRHGG